jgi:hypothetical protein
MKKNKIKIVYQNRFFKIGLEKDYYSFIPRYKDVIILPIIDKNKFLLIKANRQLIKKSLYEFPAGGFDNLKEKPLDAAKREFEEETGIKTKKNQFFKIGKSFQIPNRIKDEIYIFGVNIKIKEVKKNFTSSEVKSVKIKSIKEILSLIKKGSFCTAVPCATLFYYLVTKNKIKL